jgi:hypothetical protein
MNRTLRRHATHTLLTTLRAAFPHARQATPKPAVHDPLELRLASRHTLTVSRLQGDILLSLETPLHTRGGLSLVTTQLRLEATHIAALRAYLAEHEPPPPEAA